jgi:hypothetical protein
MCIIVSVGLVVFTNKIEEEEEDQEIDEEVLKQVLHLMLLQLKL